MAASRTYYRASAKQFIEAWQASNSVAEVAEKLRMSRPQVRVRASRYRQRGIPLKAFPPVPLPDWPALAAYAADLVSNDPPADCDSETRNGSGA